MAKHFPEIYPKEPNQDDPEYMVFEMLRELPDSYSVIYSKKFKGGEKSKEEAEVDFLIFDGKKNLICLEVKGGEMLYHGEERQWYQNGKPMDKDPVWQASGASHAVIDFLGRDGKGVNINWALAFPQCSRPAGSGRIPDVPNELILDAEALLDPVAAIQQLSDYNESHLGREGVSKYQASTILERLLRSIGFITKIGVRLLQDSKQLVSATEQQLEVLDDIEINRRTAVMGYAGTGKTIIATEFAKRQAEREQRVLLLFYNRMVSNSVRYGLGRESPIECMTFHSFARHTIDEQEPGWWEAQPNKKSAEFWEIEVPIKLLEALESKEPCYDTVIIDEGQDFKSEWIEAFDKVLVDQESSRFVIFYDAKQDIFGRWSSIPWEEGTYSKKQLKKNCRNSKTIVAKLNELSPSDMVPFEQSPEGTPIKLRECDSSDEQLTTLKSDLEDLVKGGVEPGKIVILIDCPYQQSVASDIGKIGKHPVAYLGKTYRPDSREIQVTTIDSFKGLEADVVIMVGHNDQNSAASPHTLYTEASRARLILYIYA